MVCPNCGHVYDHGTNCPQCKLDTVLFTRTVKISDSLYNKGLAQLKLNDFSSAIDSLTKSIEINKNNIQARNLLGLALFEIGHIGTALKHWVISSSLLKDENPAARYIDEAQKSGRVLERLNDSVRMYNQALEYIKQKSDDMAIIQLKKAIEINPKFVDALNLLTLCYLIQRDKEKASQTAERVLALDVNNAVALNYYFEIHPSKTRPDTRAKKTSAAPQPTSYQKVTVREKKNTNFHIMEILFFVIGAVCMFGALYVLVMPAITREHDKQLEEYQGLLASSAQQYESQLEALNLELVARDNQIDTMGAEVDNWIDRYEMQERTNKVLIAHGFLTDAKYQEAVDYIADVDTNGLAYDIVEKAESINLIAYPKLAQQYYEQGSKAYDAKDYAKALVDLERAYLYVADGATIYPDVLYYLGLTYALEEETSEDARELLGKLVNDYPRYRRISQAKQKLNSLG